MRKIDSTLSLMNHRSHWLTLHSWLSVVHCVLALSQWSQPFQVNSPLCRSLIYHPPPNPRAVADEGQQPVASHPGWGGGSELGWVEHQARIQDFLKGGEDIHKHHPPLDIVPRDVINLKNSPTVGHSQAHPPLDIVRVTSSIWKTPPTLGHAQAPPLLDIALWRHPHFQGGGGWSVGPGLHN